MVETRAIEVGDLAFTCDLAGPSNGPPVLMLHGFPQSRWAWRRQLEEFGGVGRCPA